MKPKIFLPLLLSFYILNCTLYIDAQATVRYISPTGSSTPPYTSWETAADSIKECINISVFGDTIYVANGTYKEQVVMIPGLSLIGAGMDSCVIDTRELVTSTGFISVEVKDSCLFKGFQILVYYDTEMGYGFAGSGNSLVALNRITNARYGAYVGYTGEQVPVVYKNIFENVHTGVELFNSSAIIRGNSIFTDMEFRGINIGAFFSTYTPLIDSNYIVAGLQGIAMVFGTKATINNNTIFIDGQTSYGIIGGNIDTVWIQNNTVITEYARTGISNFVDPAFNYNNFTIGNFSFAGITAGNYNMVVNNNVMNSLKGFTVQPEQNPIFRYNNSWNNPVNYSGFTPDSTNLSVDPMVVSADSNNFHLQKFSPLIDTGDPNILDRDGSRSDIGLYGGPYGWSYTYNDLAPRPPHNLTAVVEDGLIKLTWNKNTEADFSHYRIYRDTVTNFIYDTTKIVGITSDTLFYDNLTITNTEKKYYYLLTAFDNQNNQSEPSEEVTVTITGLTEHPPIGDDGFRLLSNYPNPFNPSTIIPYRLKEPGYVKLYVYDVKGELVKTLVNQWQNKGYYEVVFQPNTEERERANSYEVPMGPYYSDIATGIYIYQIMVKGEGDIPVFSDMKKMILLK
ncbi:MAG: right-handed parallel beta-helix repeat-containing protein [Ignavibacteriales bacterium]|nr:right-handed parallel beta-helix repeat-containing protein [Ignavibacteriales bacterium]